ncbi:MAG: HAMP domain-containing histidine kinase, partial [Deltaproteobacteria bacterium]|nr:HAMP domain-containing histidine kinase [Deltaproteobacteria bacterium]
ARRRAPELILLDIALPQLDGYEVALRLRGLPDLAAVPIIAITAEGDRETSLAVGCDGFVVKPIDARGFAGQVARFIRQGRTRAARSPRAADQEALRRQSSRIVGHLEEKVRELSEANARLEQLARRRNALYRNLTHELATPLTPVVGYLDMLIGERLGPLSPPQRKSLLAVNECVGKLRTLIDTLLDITSLETGRIRFSLDTYDFGDLIRGVVAELEPRASARSISLQLARLPGPMSGMGDSQRIGRAIRQLVDNAVKFSGHGGCVGVQAFARGDDLVVLVADDGPGIAADQLARVVEPFYQIDSSETRQHGGVGIGLTLARRIAEAAGGGIVLESPPTRPVDGRAFAGTLVELAVARVSVDPNASRKSSRRA